MTQLPQILTQVRQIEMREVEVEVIHYLNTLKSINSMRSSSRKRLASKPYLNICHRQGLCQLDSAQQLMNQV